MKLSSTALLLCLLSVSAFGHHSISEYTDEISEIEGVVTVTRWRNPHVEFEIIVTDAESRETVWNIEGNPLNALERKGINPDTVRVGDAITVAGRVSTRRENQILAENFLLPSGTELLMSPASQPRWSVSTHVLGTNEEVIEESKRLESQRTANGIFRVWTREPRGRIAWAGGLPLTASAEAIRASFDPLVDNPLLDCTPPGMPRAIIGNAWPIEFVEVDGEILLRMEEFDIVRTIHLEAAESAVDQPPTPLGYSVGHWEENTLVVGTTQIDWPFLDNFGVSQSSEIELTERFILSEGDARLDYEITVDDPETFTRTVTGTRTWLWIPGMELKPYECSTLG